MRTSSPASPRRFRRLIAYADLVRKQEEALERDDLDAFRHLARRRRRAQEELGEEGGEGGKERNEGEGNRGEGALVALEQRAVRALEEALARDHRIRRRLQELRDAAAHELGSGSPSPTATPPAAEPTREKAVQRGTTIDVTL